MEKLDLQNYHRTKSCLNTTMCVAKGNGVLILSIVVV